MANISDACGSITIVADSKEAAEVLLHTYKVAEYWDYGTIGVNGIPEHDPETNKWVLESGFCGWGRWSYEVNASKHLIWCINSPGDFSPEEIRTLRNSNFEIIYDFKDYECGCEFYYQEICRLIHKKGISLVDTEFVQDEYIDLDTSWGNRLAEELESEDYMIGFLIDSEPEDVYEFLERERASLEKYFGKTLEEHAEEYNDEYGSDWREILGKYNKAKKIKQN